MSDATERGLEGGSLKKLLIWTQLSDLWAKAVERCGRRMVRERELDIGGQKESRQEAGGRGKSGKKAARSLFRAAVHGHWLAA